MILLDVFVLELSRGVVRQDAESRLDAGDVFGCRVDEEVDVLGRPSAAVDDDGETADQDVAGLGLVEGAADPGDVFESWRA